MNLIYKIKSWWKALGLILLGIVYFKAFDTSAIVYLLIGLLGGSFAHAIDDNKKSYAVIYLVPIIFLSVPLSLFQQILIAGSIMLSLGYLYAKKLPISAFYKGFGYSLLFFLPATFMSIQALLVYFLIGSIATISESLHEAHHFTEDMKEKRFTTAHLLGLRIGDRMRKYWIVFVIIIGGCLLWVLS